MRGVTEGGKCAPESLTLRQRHQSPHPTPNNTREPTFRGIDDQRTATEPHATM